MNHHACEGDLVQAVVEDLPERTAVVRATRLLPINRVDRLVPKVGEPAQQPDPVREHLRECRVVGADRDETRERYEETQQSERVRRKPIWQTVVSQEVPERLEDVDLERCEPAGLVPVSLDVL